MSLHHEKTKDMLRTRQKRPRQATTVPITRMYDQFVEGTDSHRVLGVTIDNVLSRPSNIAYLCKTLSVIILQLSKIKL